MTIKITDENIEAKMIEIEGYDWAKEQARQVRRERVGNTLHAAIKGWSAGRRHVVYGAYGVHRYYIRDGGEVVFSSKHAGSEGIMKAAKAGFRIE